MSACSIACKKQTLKVNTKYKSIILTAIILLFAQLLFAQFTLKPKKARSISSHLNRWIFTLKSPIAGYKNAAG